MTFFDELGLKAAAQLEASVGPYIALASYKRLFGASGEPRTQGVLGALRCAIALGDDHEARLAAAELERLPRSPPIALGYAARLLTAGKAELAARVAQAELSRTGSALAGYVCARALGPRAAVDACATWDDVARRAQEEGAGEVLTHAAARFVCVWIERVRDDPSAALPRARLAELGESASLLGASTAERLTLSRARLLSASRFQRASALSTLEGIARHGAPAERALAMSLAARHFDGMPFTIDTIEIDRARATLKHGMTSPSGTSSDEASLALARIEAATTLLAARRPAPQLEAASPRSSARLLSGRAAAANAVTPDAGPFAAMTQLGVALASGYASDRAEVLLADMTKLLSVDVPVPAVCWSAARTALELPLASTRALAARFVERALNQTMGLPPPPLTALARALLRAGAPETAALTLEEAARHREPDALRDLAGAKRASAYDALARGDRTGGRALLEQAAELLARQPGMQSSKAAG